MPRPSEGRGLGGRRGEHSAGQCTVVSGYSGGDGGVECVDGDGVGGTVGFGVVPKHLREFKAIGEGWRHGSADQAAGFRGLTGSLFVRGRVRPGTWYNGS